MKTIFTFLVVGFLSAAALAAPPPWWSERGVIQSGAAASDFSPANAGQLKWFSSQAFAEIDAHAQRGNNATVENLILGWLPGTGNNFVMANIGQGKNVADTFYQSLNAQGFDLAFSLTGGPANNHGPLNVGQLKRLFDFNVFGAPKTGEPFINEFVAEDSIFPAGNTEDWIEIHNPTTSTIDLSNYWLTDDPGGFDWDRTFVQDAWQFPPGTTLAAGAYLVVLAADNPVPGYLHTGFKLDADGEYLALLKGPNRDVVQHFFPRFPLMDAGRSFGLENGTRHATFLVTPSPGSVNGATLARTELVRPPVFAAQRGFKTAPFQLILTAPDAGSTIYYRLGGDEPKTQAQYAYNPLSPPTISQTTVVRAFAERSISGKKAVSEIQTHTYIFANQVPDQDHPGDPRYPTSWEGLYFEYDMDPAVVATDRPGLVAALQQIPSVCLSVSPDNLYDFAENQEIEALFEPYEQQSVKVSFEWINPTPNQPSLQRDVEAEVTGDSSILWHETSKKKSMKLRFNKDHLDGGVRFDFFDKGRPDFISAMALKTPTHDSWHINPYFWGQQFNEYAMYVPDQMVARTYKAMGALQPDNRTVHVYINGLYWGVYVLHERPDEAFMAKHLGGQARQFQSFDDTGNPPGFDNPDNTVLDDYIDYIICNIFLRVGDWPWNNERVTGRQTEPHDWHFFAWGLEYMTMEEQRIGEVEEVYSPSSSMDLYGRLGIWQGPDPAFQQRFRNRLTMHCTGNGALTLANLHARFDGLYNTFRQVAIAESARWGNSYSGIGGGTYPSYTVQHLDAEKARTDNFINEHPWYAFEAFNTALGLGLTNPYPP